MPGGKQPHAFRVLPQHSAAAFPFGKVQQRVKIPASEQDGTADRDLRAILRCAQPENVPFFFLRARKRSAHPVYGAAPQQRLITRHKQTAAKRRLPAQQGGQPEPHGVAAVGQGVQQRGNAQSCAQPVNLLRARYDQTRRDAGRCCQCAAQHRLAAEVREQLVRPEPPRKAGGHDDRADCFIFHRRNTAQSAPCPRARIHPGSFHSAA